MYEMMQTAIEWTGINLLAAQIMAWISANGALGLAVLISAGVVLVFLAAGVLMHKLDRIPVTIPYARMLIPLAVVMAMIIFMGLTGVTVAMYWRESSPAAHSSPDDAERSAGMTHRNAAIKPVDPVYYPDFGK